MIIDECHEIDNPFPDCRTFKVTFRTKRELIEHHFTFQEENDKWSLHHIYPGVSSQYLNQMSRSVWERVRTRLLFK
jgi:predicted transcriptional regulator